MDETVQPREAMVPPGDTQGPGGPPPLAMPSSRAARGPAVTAGELSPGVAGRGRWPAGRGRWPVPGGLLLILVFLTVNVLADGPMIAADRWIRAWVRSGATSATWRWLADGGHAPAQLLVDLGNYQVAGPVLAACALVVAIRHRTPRPLLAALAAVVLLLVTVTAGKILIARTGPGLASPGTGGLGVFPSGHTTTAAVCFGTAAALLLPDLPARGRRVAVAVVAGMWLLVGVSLVWCDYHWFTDVLAGWALAGLIVPSAVRLSRWSPRRRARGRG